MIELSFPAVLLLLGAGILFVAIEVFVTPGLGIKGLIGVGCIAAAVILAYAQHGALRGTLVLVAALSVIGGGGWIASRTVGKRMVLNASLPTDQTLQQDLATLVGTIGVALSPLRPAGTALFGERRVDVTCESDFVEAGTPVVVVHVAGSRVKVERCT